MNAMEHAALAAAEYGGAPARTLEVGPEADIELGTGRRNPFDGLQLTAWVDSFDDGAVAAGRSE